MQFFDIISAAQRDAQAEAEHIMNRTCSAARNAHIAGGLQEAPNLAFWEPFMA